MYFSPQYKYIHNKFMINFNVFYEYFGIFATTTNKTQLLNIHMYIAALFVINENNTEINNLSTNFSKVYEKYNKIGLKYIIKFLNTINRYII